MLLVMSVPHGIATHHLDGAGDICLGLMALKASLKVLPSIELVLGSYHAITSTTSDALGLATSTRPLNWTEPRGGKGRFGLHTCRHFCLRACHALTVCPETSFTPCISLALGRFPSGGSGDLEKGVKAAGKRPPEEDSGPASAVGEAEAAVSVAPSAVCLFVGLNAFSLFVSTVFGSKDVGSDTDPGVLADGGFSICCRMRSSVCCTLATCSAFGSYPNCLAILWKLCWARATLKLHMERVMAVGMRVRSSLNTILESTGWDAIDRPSSSQQRLLDVSAEA